MLRRVLYLIRKVLPPPLPPGLGLLRQRVLRSAERRERYRGERGGRRGLLPLPPLPGPPGQACSARGGAPRLVWRFSEGAALLRPGSCRRGSGDGVSG